jgi:membrane protease YdiL (CAAX protease family)
MTAVAVAPRNGSDRTRSIVDVTIFVVVVVAVDFGASLWIDEQSLLGGSVPLLTSMALAWILLALRGVKWRAVGLRRPRPLWALPLVAALIVAVAYGILAVVRPLLVEEANAERFAPLEGNLGLYIQIMLSVWITAALFEEMIYRGFLLSRLIEVFGPKVPGLILANLVQGTLFGLIHWYQGLPGIVLTGTVGLIFGAFYFLPGRNLWPLILAHGVINSISLTAIFLYGVPGSE